MPVLRDAADSRRHDDLWRGTGQLLAFYQHRTGRDRAHPRKRLGQLGLTVAGDPGHADDLAAMDLERDIVQRQQPVCAHGRQVADAESRLAAAPEGLLVAHAEGRAPDHHACQLALVCRPRHRAHHAAAPHDADPVADHPDFAELVADEDDREAVRHEAAQGREEGFHLVRHEDRRGLVEDEHAAVARQGLDDLDPLLLSDRELLDDGIRPHGDAEPLGRLHHCSARRGEVQPGAPGTAEDDVLGHGHGLHQGEVLGHHAHACRDGITRGADARRPPVDADVAGVGSRQSIEDAHQRRLAGAVLAEQRMDLAARQVEVDARRWRRGRQSAC